MSEPNNYVKTDRLQIECGDQVDHSLKNVILKPRDFQNLHLACGGVVGEKFSHNQPEHRGIACCRDPPRLGETRKPSLCLEVWYGVAYLTNSTKVVPQQVHDHQVLSSCFWG